MNAETRRPLLLAIAAASVLTVGGLAWLARGLFAPAEPVGSPSLLEWLNDSRQPGTEKPERQQRVPAPPAHEAWISPLRQTCPIREPALQKRLTRDVIDCMSRGNYSKVEVAYSLLLGAGRPDDELDDGGLDAPFSVEDLDEEALAEFEDVLLQL